MSGLDERGIASTLMDACVKCGPLEEVDDQDCHEEGPVTVEVSVMDEDDPTIRIITNDTVILFGWSDFAQALFRCDWNVVGSGAAGDVNR